MPAVCFECHQEFDLLYGNWTYSSERICNDCSCGYIQCDMCSSYVKESDVTIAGNGDSLCPDCADHTAQCDDCGCRFYEDDLEDGLCEECEREQEDERDHYDYESPHYTSLDPLRFYDCGEADPLYFGIELEMECTDCDESIYEASMSLPEWTSVTSDCSLNHGMEVRSHPQSWEWLQKNGQEEWGKVLSLRHSGWRGYKTTTAGIHIHMSINSFSTLQLFKFLKLLYENRDFTLAISRRTASKFDYWGGVSNDGGADEASMRKKANDKHSYCKSTAVNMVHDGTIEIRIFRSTLDPKGFFGNIEFCKAVYEFTKVATINKITVPNFIEYAKEHGGMYPNLMYLLERTGQIERKGDS